MAGSSNYIEQDRKDYIFYKCRIHTRKWQFWGLYTEELAY